MMNRAVRPSQAASRVQTELGLLQFFSKSWLDALKTEVKKQRSKSNRRRSPPNPIVPLRGRDLTTDPPPDLAKWVGWGSVDFSNPIGRHASDQARAGSG